MYIFTKQNVLKRQHYKCLIFTAFETLTFIAAKLNWFTVVGVCIDFFTTANKNNVLRNL